MSAQIIPFKIESHQLRVIADEQGEPWFVAADVCEILEYANAPQAIAKNCRQAGISKRDISSGGQTREVLVINEGNLYRLILKSRKPVAERLEALVCDEILPTLRKTGKYEAPTTIVPEQQNALQQIIKRIAAGDGKRTVALWSRFNNHFRLGSYKQLPGVQFAEAVTYLEGLTGEYLPKPEPVNALHQMPDKDQLLKELIEERLGMVKMILSFDQEAKASVQLIKPGALVFSPAELPGLIANGGAQIPRTLLPDIIEAAARRLR